MKKTIYLLTLALTLLSGVVLANCEMKNEDNSPKKPSSIADKKANEKARKKWEGSPDGKRYMAWKVSPLGKKVQASYEKIKPSLKAFSKMEAVVTCMNYQRPSTNNSGPKWLIVEINGERYMMQFIPKEFELLKDLKVNDKITIKSRSAGLSDNHPHLILSSDYIEHNNKVLFERDLSKNNGC
jgi:hypothetical protein